MLAQPLSIKVMDGLGSNAGELGGTPEEHGRASSSVHSLLNCGIVVLDTSQHDFHHLVVFC